MANRFISKLSGSQSAQREAGFSFPKRGEGGTIDPGARSWVQFRVSGKWTARPPTLAWYGRVQTLALFRAGELPAAAKSHERSKQLGWSAGGRALNEVVTAMLERRLGRGSSAMVAFAAARPVFARTPTAHIPSDVVLTDWLEFQVLRGQIEGPLEDAAFPADPFAGGRR